MGKRKLRKSLVFRKLTRYQLKTLMKHWLSRHEPVQHEAFIVDPLQTPGSPDSSELRVDTLFIESMPSAQLVQFIGEMAYSAERNERFLRASAAKDVSDLDVRMYTKALEQRQRYLSSRNCQATPMDISEDGWWKIIKQLSRLRTMWSLWWVSLQWIIPIIGIVFMETQTSCQKVLDQPCHRFLIKSKDLKQRECGNAYLTRWLEWQADSTSN